MITVAEMKQLEENCGISKFQLMENAGKGIYNALKDRFENLKDKKILVVTYHGNNGGDGFVASRYLFKDAETDVLFIGDEDKFKEEAKVNFERIEKDDKIQLFIDPEQTDFNDYDIVIDALLGTGASGEIKEPIGSTIDEINDSSAFKVSVDVPTGVNPETGEESNKFVKADLIIAFHDIKKGLEKFMDKTVVVDIGIK